MAEGARLESVFAGNRNAGSNPAPSASYAKVRSDTQLFALFVSIKVLVGTTDVVRHVGSTERRRLQGQLLASA